MRASRLMSAFFLAMLIAGETSAQGTVLFNQTEYSATSIPSWYNDNWYQLGSGFTGLLQTLTIKCSTDQYVFNGGVYLALQEFTDAGYSNLANTYRLGDDSSCNLAGFVDTTFTNLNITLRPDRFYLLFTTTSLQNTSVRLLGTTSIGYAMYNYFSYGTGRVQVYYSFYPYMVPTAPIFVPPPQPSGIIQQQLDNSATGFNPNANAVAQVFVASNTGFAQTLMAQDTAGYFGNYGIQTPTATAYIYDTKSPMTASSTNLLAQSETLFRPTGQFTFAFSAPPLLLAGHTYTWIVVFASTGFPISSSNFDGSLKNTVGGPAYAHFTDWTQGGFSPTNYFFVLAGLTTALFTPPPPGLASDPTTRPAFASEPVNTGNGNYFCQHTDIAIPGRGMPLVFERSYNALDNYFGPLGANWTHSYNVLLQDRSASVAVKWGDGHGEIFTLSGGNYIPPAGVFSTLVKNTDGTFVLTQKNQTKYAFSAGGNLVSVQDKNGNTISLTYDGAGNLTRITDTVGRNLTLSYDASNRITQVTDPIGRTVAYSYSATSNDLTQVTDPARGATQFAYGASHHVTSITLPNSQTLLQNTYDAAGRVITQTNGRGFTTTFAYDMPTPGQTTITDARGKQTVHTYDASLRITTITDALGGMVSYSYDTNNDRTSVTNQNGKTTTFAYDGIGNVTSITDPLANASLFTYDAGNDLLTATNPKGKTTTFTYDANGNLRTIQDALGDTTTFAYDGSGQLSSKTDANGHATTYGYDGFGNLTQITDPLGDLTTLGYDGIGRLTSLTDPNHHTATSAYDSLSRLTTVTDPLGHQTKFMYDAVGNLQKITDANGHVTSYAYDAVNNLVTVTDALGHVTQYAYDPNNNRTGFTNAKGNATSYAYDDLNRLSSVTDPLSFVTAYAYDPVGNVKAVKDANGKTNQFAYDQLNRLTGISYADGENVTYAYDADGNRTSMLDSHGTTLYAYDDLDRLTNVTFPGGKTVAYGHDAVGNRNSLTYPDGKLVNYAYDAVNRLAGVTDWLGRTTSYSYDAASNLLATAYPNKAAISFAYDAANRLTSVANSIRGVPAVVIAYTLDGVGNRTKESVDGVATAFGYDALNQLASVQLGPLKGTWTYDAVGNRLKQTSPLGTVAYTYDAGDRLLTAGLAKYTYDNNGNQVAKTSGKLTWTYAYDAANRLVQALGYGMNSTFGYDGDGNRISQTNGSSTYSYLNDVATALPVVLNEQGPDGNITYAYGLGLIEESSPKFNYFYHYDGLGSVIALTDANGKPQAAYAYDPWGSALLTVTDAVGTKNKFRFTGEALDPGTGLYYLRARYYDPGVGRFLGKDGFGWLVRDPRTGNKYSYVLSNPVQYRDPSGRFPTSVVQFFADLWDSASAANNAYEANQRLSQQCGYTGGSLDNCTQDVQLESQRQQQIAIRSAGKAAQSGIGVIYDPSLGGTGSGNSSVSDLFGIPGDVSWLVGKVKQLFTIPTAQAAERSQTGAAGNPPAEPNQPGASANPFLGLETQTNAPSVPSGGGAQQRK